MSPQPRQRLSADARRASILVAATACFAARGFGGTTTATIAAAANVNEALVFRHFHSKQVLYLACVDSAWQDVRARCDELFDEEPDARHWRMPGRAFLELVRERPAVAQLWARCLVETTGIEDIDVRLAERMTEIHAFVQGTIERSARDGGLLPGRDPATEAWAILGQGLLGATLGTRGLVARGDYDTVLAAHRTWMTGDPA